MTITPKSDKHEISDLQRLLLSLGLMKFTDKTQSGRWGDETQDAVVALYDQLGWDHDGDAKWVTATALAAISGLHAAHHAERHVAAVVGGGGSMAGGGGSMAGGGGSMAGGGGSMAGGGGSMAGGGGSMAGGGGSMAGGGGSMAGGDGSHAGDSGSHAG